MCWRYEYFSKILHAGFWINRDQNGWMVTPRRQFSSSRNHVRTVRSCRMKQVETTAIEEPFWIANAARCHQWPTPITHLYSRA